MAFPFSITEHTIPTQHIREHPRATAHSQEDVLHLHIKQYTPLDNPNPQPGDVTIIGAHANGFPKELYEALWADLHALSHKHGFRIRGIWIADVANQGYSGTLNEGSLGNDPCWHDHARDLLHMTNVFRAAMPRPLVGVGHSFGGNILTQLALLHPRLLTTLILLDPVIVQFGFDRSGPGSSPTQSSTFRRETWPSRQAAAEAFARSPFYKSWDPRVLAAWNAHAIRDTPTPLFPNTNTQQDSAGATLRTTKHQEVFTFFRPLWPHVLPDGSVDPDRAPDFDPTHLPHIDPHNPYPFYRSEGAIVLRRLPEVRPSVLWVYGGTSDLSPPAGRAHKLAVTGTGPGGSGGAARGGRVAEVVVEVRGHLFPMEVPAQTAAHAAAWIGREMERWRGFEREYDDWVRLPMREKSTLSEEVMEKVGRPPARRPKKAKGTDGEPKL
ncbi:Uu.00g126590.m01.CDS01 [Anthostomella pinea]|uniref:Uu.00g126590.m01.CDS01 n=1 Tax=Anthostomella pinea TaxID=933095 RepID=A0AAI8YHP8_9PEZI|nr:Uu.00g126590.m01.CDS01 [Anthostomella pinea]